MDYKRKNYKNPPQRISRKKRRQYLIIRFFIISNFSMIIIIIILVFANLQMQRQLREIKPVLTQTEEAQSKDTSYSFNSSETVEYIDAVAMTNVDRPQNRNKDEISEQLQKLGQGNEMIQEIYTNASLYPESILEALANNPEMADFVKGYLTKDPAVKGNLTTYEKTQEYPLLLQWDPRWGYVPYGDNNMIGLAGCGPTCLSMVLYYLTKDETLTPDTIASYSMENGYYMQGTGTKWALMEDFPRLKGLEVNKQDIKESNMINALEQGRILICAMREGDFTAGGHFIVIYGYDHNGFKVNDPNCVSRSRKQWTYNEIGHQIKSMWSYR